MKKNDLFEKNCAFDFSKLALVCSMKISGASVHRLVTRATRNFKFIPKIRLLWSYQAINVWPLQLLWQHSCNAIPCLRWHAMHAMLLRISSCIPVLILKKSKTQKVSPLCWAYTCTWALHWQKSKYSLFPSPLGSNDWCIMSSLTWFYTVFPGLNTLDKKAFCLSL